MQEQSNSSSLLARPELISKARSRRQEEDEAGLENYFEDKKV